MVGEDLPSIWEALGVVTSSGCAQADCWDSRGLAFQRKPADLAINTEKSNLDPDLKNH